MEEEQHGNQREKPDSLRPQENSEETSEEVTVPKSVPTHSFSSLLPKALSAVLQPTTHSTSDPRAGRDASGKTPAGMEQLRTELRDLRDQFDQMKTQHK